MCDSSVPQGRLLKLFICIMAVGFWNLKTKGFRKVWKCFRNLGVKTYMKPDHNIPIEDRVKVYCVCVRPALLRDNLHEA